MRHSSEVAVILFVFNRPDTTVRVLKSILKHKPVKLYVFGDGPRNEKDLPAINETRQLLENTNWPGKVELSFSGSNMGCAQRIISGLNEVFSKEEHAIILEDDCLPGDSFFPFCGNILQHYAEEERIMHVSGFNILGRTRAVGDYWFSNYAFPPWGWATWRRAWEKYAENMSRWDDLLALLEKKGIFDVKTHHYWNQAMIRNQSTHKTWDHQWAMTIWENNGLAIIPKKNLVSNIGFDSRALHTQTKSKYSNTRIYSLEEQLLHPEEINACLRKDKKYALKINDFIRCVING